MSHLLISDVKAATMISVLRSYNHWFKCRPFYMETDPGINLNFRKSSTGKSCIKRSDIRHQKLKHPTSAITPPSPSSSQTLFHTPHSHRQVLLLLCYMQILHLRILLCLHKLMDQQGLLPMLFCFGSAPLI